MLARAAEGTPATAPPGHCSLVLALLATFNLCQRLSKSSSNLLETSTSKLQQVYSFRVESKVVPWDAGLSRTPFTLQANVGFKPH